MSPLIQREVARITPRCYKDKLIRLYNIKAAGPFKQSYLEFAWGFLGDIFDRISNEG